MSNPHQTYLNLILPQISAEIRSTTLDAYPDVCLEPTEGCTPLADCNIVMLIGLTGTGKSTTLRALDDAGTLPYTTDIPTRRQLADLILIPYAQRVSGEPISPVKDRTQRFAYTRAFREQVAGGGTAVAFTWLYYKNAAQRVLSEGVRGHNEIQYALNHTRWRLIELWIDPVTRLRRLSGRGEAFDMVANPSAEDLSFLPESRVDEVRAALEAGEITPAAVTTVRAEALNYGTDPFDAENKTPRYRCLSVEGLSPAEVAAAVTTAVTELDAEITD